MRKLTIFGLLLSCFAIVACSSDNEDINTDTIPSTKEGIKTLLVGNWGIEDSRSPFKSIEFDENDNYILINDSNEKVTGSYTISDDLRTLVLDNTSRLTLLNLTSDNLKFSIKTDSGEKITLNGKSIEKQKRESVKVLYTYDGSLYYCDEDGKNPKIIVNQSDLTDIGYVSEYGWFPDASKVFFTNDNNNGGSDYFIVNTDGTSLTSVKNNFKYIYDFVITPDGKSIVYFNYNKLYTCNLDGTNEQIIGQEEFYESVSISPDGSKIAFTRSANDGMSIIYNINYDGSNLKVIKQDSEYHYADVKFSPDGNYLLYSKSDRVSQKTNDLICLNLKENKETLIYTGHAMWAHWHPNGESIYFTGFEYPNIPGSSSSYYSIMKSIKIDGSDLKTYDVKGALDEQVHYKPIIVID